MTEDDTFRRLKRLPYDMVKTRITYMASDGKRYTEGVGPEFNAYLETVGWTPFEYFEEYVRRRRLNE